MENKYGIYVVCTHRPCDSGWWPSADQLRCDPLTVQFIRWGSLYAALPAGLSALGVLVTCLVACTFVRHIETPVVKASGRELSFMLFAGFLLCYSMTFVLLARPSAPVCAVQRCEAA